VDTVTHARLLEQAAETPSIELTIDLAAQTLTFPGCEAVPFPIDPFSKTCLLNGLDQLGYLLSFSDQIMEYES
jgi:3-isopropylmalate/(R)-2-methylmalate dehydratase small subunit